MREGYDTQQVCLNGHQVTAAYHSSPEFREAFCADCGEATIFACPHCRKEIKGRYHSPGFVSFFETPVPANCHGCGRPYPWTERKSLLAKAASSGGAQETLVILRQVLKRFHLLVRQIRQRHDSRTTLDVADEYDVQDLLHSVLVMFFDDVRAEEYTPSYAAKSTRMDFLLKAEQVVVEAKMTRAGLAAKEVGTQLIEDIARYRAHPDCKHLFCFVYDPDGRIANPKGVEHDLSRDDGQFKVEVFIVPKGH